MKNFSVIFRAIGQFKRFLVLIFILYALAMVFGLVMPKIQGVLVDALAQGELDGLGKAAQWLVIVLSLSVITAFSGEVVAWMYTIRVKSTLLNRVSSSLLKKQMAFYTKYDTGYITSRMYEVFRLEPLFGTSIISIAMTLISFVGALVLMFQIDLWLSVVCLFLTPVYLISSYCYTAPIKRAENRQQENVNLLTSLFISLYNAVVTFRLFNATGFFGNRFERKADDYFAADFKTHFLRTQFQTLSTIAGRAAPVLVLVVGGTKVIQGTLTIGLLFEFLGYLPFLYKPFDRLTSFYSSFLGAKVSLDRICAIMDESPEAAAADGLPCPPIREIAFRGVHYAYQPEKPVLEDLDFRLVPGDVAALIGESGTGKTTALNLLMENITPDSGAITINGEDYRRFRASDKRARMVFLTAKPALFSGSIRDNITLGADFEDAAVERVLLEVNLMHRIGSLDQGVKTEFNERDGLDFSEGEKQRIALARALIREPDVLIFDESTNHLDRQNEEAILTTIRSAFADKIVLLVSHNLKDYFGVTQEIHLDREFAVLAS